MHLTGGQPAQRDPESAGLVHTTRFATSLGLNPHIHPAAPGRFTAATRTFRPSRTTSPSHGPGPCPWHPAHPRAIDPHVLRPRG